jgi:glycerophosphoryl diester phosphodiesterase
VPLLSECRENEPSGILPPALTAANVEYFCQHEWARHLDDVLLRRSGWHYYLDDPPVVAAQVSRWMGETLGWSEQQRQAELKRYQALVAPAQPTTCSRPIRSGAVKVAADSAQHDSWIVAHRGASGDAPESTLAAFRAAWEQGSDGIEGDFFLTRDGQIVCTHDPQTGDLADGDLDVSDSTLAELKKLDFGIRRGAAWRGERIPTLEEVIETIPVGKKLFVELKGGPEIVSPMAKVLQQSSLANDQVYVISFQDDTLRECKQQLPDIRTHWLSSFYLDESTNLWTPTAGEVAEQLRKTLADGFGGQNQTGGFDANFVAALRDEGYREFHVWWVNDARSARFYRDWGALSLTTDHPGRIRAELAKPAPTEI